MRRDVFINCAAPLFVVSSRDLGGRDRADVVADLRDAVAAGLVFPLMLPRPEPFVVRVVEGELSDAEEAEWVGHCSGALVCPEGVMHIEGGFGALPDQGSLRVLQIPSGRHRLDLYTYMGGSANGDTCYREVSEGVPLGHWFRETRPGEEFPDWLALRCMEDPDLDPRFEKDWEELAASRSLARTRSRLLGRPAVAFVVQLRPWNEVLPPPVHNTRGRIPPHAGARLPDFCPRGIDATIALQIQTDETDLPVVTEQPEFVLHQDNQSEGGFWKRVRRWVGGD